jgi:hypothetical protein
VDLVISLGLQCIVIVVMTMLAFGVVKIQRIERMLGDMVWSVRFELLAAILVWLEGVICSAFSGISMPDCSSLAVQEFMMIFLVRNTFCPYRRRAITVLGCGKHEELPYESFVSSSPHPIVRYAAVVLSGVPAVMPVVIVIGRQSNIVGGELVLYSLLAFVIVLILAACRRIEVPVTSRVVKALLIHGGLTALMLCFVCGYLHCGHCCSL